MSPRADLLDLVTLIDDHLERVEREAAEIERLTPRTDDPTQDELWLVGAHLQSFYTGLEYILIHVFERFEEGPPRGADSHARLLQLAACAIPTLRPAILERATAETLHAYLSFRHFFRHAYGVSLKWPKMEEKVRGIRPTFDRLRRDLDAFRDFLVAAANA